MLKKIVAMGFCFVALTVSPAIADETGSDHSHDKEKLKIELATKLNNAWGVKDQANMMINLISREVPGPQKESFRAYMSKVIDLDEVDRISVGAAVEVFTVEELEVMLEYYSNDIVKAAEKKRVRYNRIIAPKIKTMIDKGMIEAAGELERMKSLQ